MTGISQVASQNFNAVPRAVNNRSKYRPAGSDRGSISADPRVRRIGAKQAEVQPFATPLPEVIKGEVNLEYYLTERTEPTKQVAVDAQTDNFKSRPGDPSTGLGNVHAAVNSLAWPSNYKLDKYDDDEKQKQDVPLDIVVDGVTVAGNIFQDYVPRKTGVDAETHIEEGDIFNFNDEISSVIKVIVDKTCEQALMEVEQESYLSNISAARANFQELEKKTLEDWKAQDDAEKARQKYMENTIKQARKMYKSDLKMKKRIASHEFAKNMLANLVTDVLDREEQRGAFISSADVAISNEFLPWLLQQTIQSVAQEREISSALDDVQKTVIQEACDDHAKFAPQWIEADAARLLAAQEARRPKSNEIFFHIDIDGASVKVGPVTVTETDEVGAVEERVYDWLKANCDNIDIKEVMPHGVVLCLAAEDAEAEAPRVTNVSEILSSQHEQIVMRARREDELEGDAAAEE